MGDKDGNFSDTPSIFASRVAVEVPNSVSMPEPLMVLRLGTLVLAGAWC